MAVRIRGTRGIEYYTHTRFWKKGKGYSWTHCNLQLIQKRLDYVMIPYEKERVIAIEESVFDSDYNEDQTRRLY